MTSRDALPDQVAVPVTWTATRPRRNPYIVALISVGGFAWLVALMLWNVLAQVTDYVTYDHDTAVALTAWINLLLLAGVVAIVGSVVIAGVRFEMRRADRN